MILVLTNSTDVTADFLVSRLNREGVELLRFDTDSVVSSAAVRFASDSCALNIGNRWYEATEFSHVWYRRPEALCESRFNDSREGKYLLNEWSEAFEGVLAHIPKERWMNHPSANAQSSHKLEQLTTATKLGFQIPDTLVTQDECELREFAIRHQGRLIVKPLSRGYVEPLNDEPSSLVYTNDVAIDQLGDLSDLSTCPTLFQQKIAKQADVRITVVDGRCHSVKLFAQDGNGTQRCDIRRDNMIDVRYERCSLPMSIVERIGRLMDFYRLRFAAIDMAISVANEWVFLEVNPNGQWAWMDICADMDIAELFVNAFRS